MNVSSSHCLATHFPLHLPLMFPSLRPEVPATESPLPWAVSAAKPPALRTRPLAPQLSSTTGEFSRKTESSRKMMLVCAAGPTFLASGTYVYFSNTDSKHPVGGGGIILVGHDYYGFN